MHTSASRESIFRVAERVSTPWAYWLAALNWEKWSVDISQIQELVCPCLSHLCYPSVMTRWRVRKVTSCSWSLLVPCSVALHRFLLQTCPIHWLIRGICLRRDQDRGYLSNSLFSSSALSCCVGGMVIPQAGPNRGPNYPSGVLGIKVKIMLPWDPSGKIGPKKPLPDHVSIVEPKDEILPTTPISEQKGGKPEPPAMPQPVPTA